jgi:hypothetical protein
MGQHEISEGQYMTHREEWIQRLDDDWGQSSSVLFDFQSLLLHQELSLLE